MQKVSLPIETVNKILNYLQTKPYSEVVLIINELSTEAEPVNNKGNENGTKA